MTSPIFTAADAAILTAQGLIQPATRNRRQISRSLMLSEASSSSDKSADSGVSHVSSLIVPEYLESVETLEHVGFKEEKAAEIWSRWEIVKQAESKEAAFQHDFLEYALSSLSDLKLEDEQEHSNTELLNWGVGDELREAIMDEKYSNVRLTESIRYWVRDTMEIRYLSLERLQRNSKMRAQTSDSSTKAATGTPQSQQVRIQAATPSTVPGRLSLYKAIATDRVRYDSAGKIAIESLVSGTPSDFRGVGGTTLYFTPSLEVAEHYRNYIRRRHNGAAPLMLELSIAESFIEALPPQILTFGDVWKEIVYTSRRGLLLRGILRRFHSLPLIIAPIARAHNRSTSRLDNYHQVSLHQHVLYVADSEAIQYVFQGDDILEELENKGDVRPI